MATQGVICDGDEHQAKIEEVAPLQASECRGLAEILDPSALPMIEPGSTESSPNLDVQSEHGSESTVATEVSEEGEHKRQAHPETKLYVAVGLGVRSTPQPDKQAEDSHRDTDATVLSDERAGLRNLKPFAPLLASMHHELVPKFVSTIRQQLALQANAAEGTEAPAGYIECEVQSQLRAGSYHIAFIIEFVDGLKWVLKIPENGYIGRLDDMTARALTAEAQTMKLLKRETTIPLPEVYAFDASAENEINCAYILMGYIDGVPLHERWLDKTLSMESLAAIRAKALFEIAAAMVQLNRFTYSKGGSPVFDHENTAVDVGRVRKPDLQAEKDRINSEDPDTSPIYCEVGPFTEPKSHLLAMLDWGKQELEDDYTRGLDKLLRFFIECIPYDVCSAEEIGVTDFVLAHPDLAFQNILVAEDGKLRGIIDWDGVAAVPRCVGNLSYPSFLTCDWDDSMEPENTPAELRLYRKLYASFIDALLPGGYQPLQNCAHLTRNTLLTKSLEIAANDPWCRDNIMDRVFKEIRKVDLSVRFTGSVDNADQYTGSDDETDDVDGFFLYEVATDLANGDLDDARIDRLMAGFEALCSGRQI